MMINIVIKSSLLAIVAMTSATSAVASVKQERVYFGDLNLVQLSSQTALRDRVEAAVVRVCARDEDFNANSDSTDEISCRRTALSKARTSVRLAIARTNRNQQLASNSAISN